ncbi:hypothetical protein HETIRDRAFT_108168 [Heterobasidion irregulare TC 32-1]|uniref:NAD(P)-binding protein n=1 Tax=Heterobasidion irregulare (strain TC 32-1) TaxID=747525 RepID=W4JP05_HETIT|nr:uncharacterized protein HETIRDRAFT_108168 [Heterobasidion irregulare TC 32-1]ETW75224.1 hypothetical protein HETIRDRAFT_108168 [Heterobasidion irregulare TC 32-1]
MSSPSPKGVALVTGAARGIGRSVALRLASDGFDVVINDIPANLDSLKVVASLIESTGRRARYIVADVSQETEVEKMVSEAVQNLGGLDVMVANAGIVLMKSFIETTADELDRILAVNIRGTFLCYKYAAKQMIVQGACSGAGKKGQVTLAAYSASKFGIRSLTQTAALELGKHGITVNAYAPGPIKTQMCPSLARYDPREPKLMGASPQMTISKSSSADLPLNKAAALGKVGVPDDIAAVASFLASKEAHLITGQCINVDGGREFD